MSAKISLKLEELSKEELIELVKGQFEEIEKLKREIRKYKNPHTPSSQNKFDKPQAQGLKVGRKEGKKSGHKGKTRAKDNPNKTIWVKADKNPSTGNTNIQETGDIEEFIITNFEIKKVVTLYKCKWYRDRDTNEVFLAKHPDIPENGIFGKNVLAFASTLHFENRVVYEGVANIFTNVFDIPMTAPTAMELCNRTANKVSYKYETLNKKLRKADVVYGDETGSNQNGIQEWLWGFFTISLAFFSFFGKRGGGIIEKVLGENFKGILSCDGWSTYKVFSEKYGILLQRCWAHLIREVKAVCKDVDGLNDAYVWIKDIFDNVKKARKLKTERLRKLRYEELVEELDRWLQIYGNRSGMKDIGTRVKNGKNHWFTCVLYPEVEPTNNRAERGLRKFVIMEKVIGCLRSEQGKKSTQVMLSLFGTWRLQGLNPYRELRAIV